jgi:hypothetical protein
MGLLEMILVIAMFGFLTWALTTLIPMPVQFKNAIYVVAVLGLVLYLLQCFGLLHVFHDIRIVR